MSRNFDKGLSFCFIVCRRWNFEEKKSYPFFDIEYKLWPYQQF